MPLKGYLFLSPFLILSASYLPLSEQPPYPPHTPTTMMYGPRINKVNDYGLESLKS
jgi:hypothetical protein